FAESGCYRFPAEIPAPSQIIHHLSVIGRSHHSSLVKLKGASISGNYEYLVYDYVSGASLADCLRNAKNPHFNVLSSWIS
ncbi:lysM domain receptor-like kinase 3, partial [Olea europaea subsp. europaea]